MIDLEKRMPVTCPRCNSVPTGIGTYTRDITGEIIDGVDNLQLHCGCGAECEVDIGVFSPHILLPVCYDMQTCECGGNELNFTSELSINTMPMQWHSYHAGRVTKEPPIKQSLIIVEEQRVLEIKCAQCGKPKQREQGGK